MSKATLLGLCLFVFVCGLVWVFTWHLTGWFALLVIFLPLVLAVVSVKEGV
ncbi:MAG TPA: hypothetical protein VGT44_08055 [Ktedonobacteraceae bacterium]|nr:hypothetical protein [Ktedonobacteraceae bacterium]